MGINNSIRQGGMYMVATLTGDASVELKKVLKAKNSDKSLRIYIAGYG